MNDMDDYDIYEDGLDEDYVLHDHEPITVDEIPTFDDDGYVETWRNIYDNCLQPSVSQVAVYMLVLLMGSVAYRLLNRIVRHFSFSEWPCHISSLVCGMAMLYLLHGHLSYAIFSTNAFGYAMLLSFSLIKCKYFGMIALLATITSHMLHETYWSEPEAWQSIRGIIMMHSMKIISLAFDMENGPKNTVKVLPSPLEYLGYVYCPASCVLGPWISYKNYLSSLQTACLGYVWLPRLFMNSVMALLFLCMSNCLVPLLCADNQFKWLVAYRDALGVRCSHYFICFASQGVLQAAGGFPEKTKKKKQALTHMLFGQMVTKPWAIEVPRSLTDVVRSWNVPMHKWLKTYIFRPFLERYNSYGVAVIITYIVSCLLHGVLFKVHVVLLSLSFFTYTEGLLRSKLARHYNMCITADPCRAPCPYAVCPSREGCPKDMANYVQLINLGFSLLTLLGLTYLGVILHVNPDADDKSYLSRELYYWSKLQFAIHLIGLLLFAGMKVLEMPLGFDTRKKSK